MKGFSAAQAWIRAHQQELVDTLIAWVEINSGSSNVVGIEKQVEAIMPLYQSWADDMSVEALPPYTLIDDHGRQQKMQTGPLLRIRKHTGLPKQILLSGHTDTVFDIEHDFQTARLEGNIIRGPGAADMKGGLLVMYAALRALQETDAADKFGWEVVLNPDEEIGSFSSREKLLSAAKNKDFALVFEPAMDEDGTLAGERKGSSKLTLIVRGKAAHVGRDFAAGANAIVAMTQIVQALHALNGRREGFILNIGKIVGGSAVNVVAELVLVRVNIRYAAGEDLAWFKQKLNGIKLHWQQEQDYELTVDEQPSREPKPLVDGNARLMQQVIATSKDLGFDLVYKATGGVSDGNIFWQSGLANVDTLGVYGGGLHSDQEYMLIDSMEKRALLTAKMLYDYAHDKWKL
jgi:glutamate carboxypeptidase